MKLLLLLLLVGSCSRKTKAPIDRTSEIKMRELRAALPEPYFKDVPDSMKHWIGIFNEVLRRDQMYRSRLDPGLMSRYKDSLRYNDSLNQQIVSNFLKKYGYPQVKQIGLKGFTALNIVIQHSPLKMQEEYYPFVRESYSKGQVSGETLALLEDRINVRNKRLQFYGTQIVSYRGKPVPYPLQSVDSVNYFRRKLGVGFTLDSYLKQFYKSSFDSIEYKKYLPELIDSLKFSHTPGIRYIKLK